MLQIISRPSADIQATCCLKTGICGMLHRIVA